MDAQLPTYCGFYTALPAPPPHAAQQEEHKGHGLQAKGAPE